jgi:hypothetical protein
MRDSAAWLIGGVVLLWLMSQWGNPGRGVQGVA